MPTGCVRVVISMVLALVIGCQEADRRKRDRETRVDPPAPSAAGAEPVVPPAAKEAPPPATLPTTAEDACTPWLRAVTEGKESATIIATLAAKRCPGTPAALEARFATTEHRRAIVDALFAFPASPAGARVVEKALADPKLAQRAHELGTRWELPGLPEPAPAPETATATATATAPTVAGEGAAFLGSMLATTGLVDMLGGRAAGQDGFGRIHGLGKIDTGGGTGTYGRLGQKRDRKVSRIRIGAGKSTGFCKKSDIARTVRRRANSIRACYEKRLQAKPTLKGKVAAEWTIGPTGTVTAGHARPETTLTDAPVTSCILRVIRRMRFPKPEGGICTVVWPFTFDPG